MTGLAVVVAARQARPEPPAAWRGLVAELSPEEDELVWVDTGPTPSGPWPGTTHVHSPAADRGQAYAAGLARVSAAAVAFTDEDTLVARGWRAGAVGALASGASVVGGPVLLSRDGSRCSRAGRLVDYLPHAVPPYLSAAGDVSGNNVAYPRTVLGGLRDTVWKSEVDAALRAQGRLPVVAEAMAVRSTRDYHWPDLLAGRRASGRLYGVGRATGWSPRRRALGAVACATLPALQLLRLTRAVRRDPTLLGLLLRLLPEVVLAEVAWSVGEAQGYLSTVNGVDDKGGRARVW